MMKLVNLTPHAINFVSDDGSPLITVDPSGTIARVSATTVVDGDINGIPLSRTAFGDVTDLPDPAPDTVYIVSSLVATRVPNRDDVFIPDGSVRDSAGRIVGCRYLGRI